jgi:hypothetical protein
MASKQLGMCLLLSAAACTAQSITIPNGTPLALRIERHMRMRIGEPIRAELIYPIYANNVLVLPPKTVVTGTVVGLHSDHARRVAARLRTDFTPFSIPVVSFTGIMLADGSVYSVATTSATDGAPIYRLVTPPPRKGGFIHQQWDNGIQVMRDRLSVVTAPDKGDRLIQLLYSQLPYHPQRIEKGTAWTVETSEPVSLPSQPVIATVPEPLNKAKASPLAQDGASKSWIIQAYLKQHLSSATSQSGDEIEATVAEPVYNADQTIAVPQGSRIIGAVTQSKPARAFGRAGSLHFDFRELILPTGETQNVQSSLVAADSSAGQKLALDSEGQAKPKPQDKLVVPFILLTLAARPLDYDHGENAFGKQAVASNSLGVLGFIVGTAARQRNIAAGIGYYGAALSIYERWIRRGSEITFAHDTRLVLQTTPRHTAVLRPQSP